MYGGLHLNKSSIIIIKIVSDFVHLSIVLIVNPCIPSKQNSKIIENNCTNDQPKSKFKDAKGVIRGRTDKTMSKRKGQTRNPLKTGDELWCKAVPALHPSYYKPGDKS